MTRFAAVRPERGDVPAVDWPRERGGVPVGRIPPDLVASVVGVGRQATYKLARRCHGEGRVRLVNQSGTDALGRRRGRVCVSESDGAYLVAVHRAGGPVRCGGARPAHAAVRRGGGPPQPAPAKPRQPCGDSGIRRVVEIAQSCGVTRDATVRLARRHGFPLHFEPGRDSRDRRRRVLVTGTGDAARLESLHRTRVERWLPPAPARPVSQRFPSPAEARRRVYRDPRWRALRASMCGPSARCEHCGASDCRLDLHHVVPITAAGLVFCLPSCGVR